MWTHRQIMETILNLQTDLPLTRKDASLVAVNLSHGPSMLPVLHQVVYVGGRLILYRGPRFQADEFSELAIREGASTTLLVPTMLSRMLRIKGGGSNWFERFKYVKYVASRMDRDDLRRAVETMHRSLVQGYGSTETVGGVTYLSPSGHDPGLPGIEKRLASAGREYTNVWVATMNEEGRLLPPGEVGQIVVRSDKNFKGYWNDPRSTREVLREGWLMTGDLGYLDQEGYLYVVDRLSDMIISGGENVYPKEIENLLSQLPRISECAVVGVPDREWGEEVWAFVIPEKGVTIKAEEVVEFCRGRLAGYKIPRRVVIRRDLPKNFLGKTQKFILEKEALELKEK
jgi:acyl-CoA synthetase (AMP-forming)/AMP-acid ligase II